MRAAVSIALAAIIIAAIVYAVFFLHRGGHAQAADARHRLIALDRRFPPPPFAHRVASHDVQTAAAVEIGSEWESNRDPNDVYAYYAAELGKRGWKHCGPAPAPGSVPDNNYFTNALDEATLQFAPENTGRYVFAFEWGANNCASVK